MVAVKTNSTHNEIFINGVSDGPSVKTRGIVASANNYIGKQHNNIRYFNGDIYNVTVFDKALSTTESSKTLEK